MQIIQKCKNKRACQTADAFIWSKCRDSNPRSLGPEPSAIPNFATPRCPHIIIDNPGSVKSQLCIFRSFRYAYKHMLLLGGSVMGYRIQYGPKKRKKRLVKVQLILSILFLFASLLCRLYWQQGCDYLRHYLLPTGYENPQSIQTLVWQLENGSNLPDAIATFFEDIIHGTA